MTLALPTSTTIGYRRGMSGSRWVVGALWGLSSLGLGALGGIGGAAAQGTTPSADQAPAAGSGERAGDAEADDARARTHFESGRSYFEVGNYERALEEFQQAYELSGRAVLLINIANCQERLGRWAEAADTVDRYAATLEAESGERATLARRAESLRARAAEREAQEEAQRAQLERARAEREAHTAEPGGPSGAGGPSASSGASDGLLVPAIVAFGVAGVAAISWGTLGGLALSEQSRVESGCGATVSCSPSEVADMDAFALGADVSMSIALVAAVAGAVMLIADPPRGGASSESAGLRVAPWADALSAGIALGGTL